MRKEERLRFRNDATFEEANPPADRREPLEWRRSFNSVSMLLRKPTVNVILSVNEVESLGSDLHFDGEGTAKHPPIKSGLKRTLRISGTADSEAQRDTLYYASKLDGESDVYSLKRPKGAIRVALVEKDGTEGNAIYAPGAHHGIVYLNDFDVEEDEPGFHFELSLPSRFMEELVSELRRDPSLGLEVHAEIRSFSYEVDDALREWYHPRDLFIKGTSAPAPLVSVRTVQAQPNESEGTEQEEDAEPASDVVTSMSPNSGANLARHSMRGVKFALWAIAVVLFLGLFK